VKNRGADRATDASGVTVTPDVLGAVRPLRLRDKSGNSVGLSAHCKVGHRPPDRDTPFRVSCNGSSNRWRHMRFFDVIVTVGGAVVAAKAATTVIPIIFAAASDRLGSSLVASLVPAGNVTGLSAQSPDIAGKQVELLRDLTR
jgi:hypothetical protein